MSILHLGWGIIWRMSIWGLGLGGAFGLVYGPVSTLTLIALNRAGLYLTGRPDDSFISWSTTLFVASVGGLMYGAIAGAVGGMLSGILMAIGLRLSLRNVPNAFRVASAFISGLTALSIMATVTLALTSRGTGDLGMLAWLVWVAIPTIVAASATWRASGRAAEWLSQRRGKEQG